MLRKSADRLLALEAYQSNRYGRVGTRLAKAHLHGGGIIANSDLTVLIGFR